MNRRATKRRSPESIAREATPDELASMYAWWTLCGVVVQTHDGVERISLHTARPIRDAIAAAIRADRKQRKGKRC